MYHLETKIESQGENITLNGTANAKFEKFGIGGNSSQETREEFKSTVTGTEVTVNDTYINNQTKFNIDGNSYQETTEGYNLLNVPAEYHISSTDINKIVPISLKANTKYTIQAEKIISDNSDVKDCLFRFRYNNADVSNPYARIPISTLKTTYIPSSDIDTVWIYSGTGYNESRISSTTFENLMIYEGTEDKPYEPYTGGIPSPSPDYPQDIEVINNHDTENKYNLQEGHIGLRQSGKNLIGLDIQQYKVDLKAGDKITMQNKTTKPLKLWLYTNYGDTQRNDYWTVGSNGIRTITVAKDTKAIRWDSTVNGIAWCIKGEYSLSTIPKYEPYHEAKVIPINLNGNSIAKVGDVKDVLKVNRNGEVEIKKNIGKVVLDGSENWEGYEESKDTAAAYLRMSDLTKTQNSNILCNKFQQINYEQDKEGIVATPYSAVLIAIRINKSRLTENSLPGIKTWLSQHPTEVYYQLATPQTISLPSISPIELWQGTNIFSLITNLDTEIELEYNYIPQSPSPEAPSEIKNVKDNINIKIADKNNKEQQEILFPFVQGQKLMQGDYLADDGIHHTRKQIVFNGKEEWKLGGRQFDKCMTFYVYARDGNTRGAKICNLFKFDDMAYIDRKDTECITNNVLGRNFFNNYSNKKVKIENRKCCGISRIFVEAIQ